MYLLTMSSVTYVPFKLWIIFNLFSLVSSNISSQRFVLHSALSISTKASDVTEITSRSNIECACECKRNKWCHRASYDRLTKRCRIFNEHTSRKCDVGLDVIQTSVFIAEVKDDCNSDWHWFEGNCYFFGVSMISWIDAQNDCSGRSACLVTIRNERENEWLVDVIKNSDKKRADYWIGANDKDIENDWVWESDKSKLLFRDWHVGEPNDGNNNEDCGKMKWKNSPYRWIDNNCDRLYLYICEK